MGHWAETAMPQLKATTRLASKYMSRPTKLHCKLVITMFRYCMYTVRESIALTLTSKDDFDGVLELLFFTDSDHVGNADGTSNSGMVAFLNGNYFHGCSCGQKCLTMNTAESEYIAMVKCLQFAIWTMLLLRELSFRVRYPIPILADNVAAILIAKSPTHTKYARHIELRTHYIRSVLAFRDFILAYVKSMWNFADLNTKDKSSNTRDLPKTKQLCTKWHTRFQIWKREAEKTLTEIWQQCKARDDSREMEKHVTQFGETRKEQRAKATAKERDLLKQEIAPALKAHFVSKEAVKNRSSTSGGVRYTVPVNVISSEEVMRFGLDNTHESRI